MLRTEICHPAKQMPEKTPNQCRRENAVYPNEILRECIHQVSTVILKLVLKHSLFLDSNMAVKIGVFFLLLNIAQGRKVFISIDWFIYSFIHSYVLVIYLFNYLFVCLFVCLFI